MSAPKLTAADDGRTSCEDCLHSALLDYGYSNYTTEGTEFFCQLDVHPDAPFDMFYGRDARLRFADTCPSFVAGDGITMDVDCEGIDDLTVEQRAWFEARP